MAEKANDLLIDVDESDMQCVYNCIEPKDSAKEMYRCMNNTCQVKFYKPVEEILRNCKEDAREKEHLL